MYFFYGKAGYVTYDASVTLSIPYEFPNLEFSLEGNVVSHARRAYLVLPDSANDGVSEDETEIELEIYENSAESIDINVRGELEATAIMHSRLRLIKREASSGSFYN